MIKSRFRGSYFESFTNTIITIVNKLEDDYKSDAAGIIEKLSGNITNSPFSFNKLLGIEMQQKFLNSGAFIDSDFFKVTKETLAFHRNQIVESMKSDISFRELLKNVFMEHAGLKLELANLKILSTDIFDEFNSQLISPKKEELASMNVFYNSVKLSIENKKLDFGDVFITEKGEFYLCITALCDCLRPEKTNYIFYFAEGINIPIDSALSLSDSAFISFISEEKAIVWSNVDNVKAKEGIERINELELFRYKPVYVKPLSYLVENPQLIDGKIKIIRAYQFEKKGGDLEFKDLKYVTTIKPSYAQRITNHAFTHPIRIGIDFVKKN
jgi:hypothetical protein